METRKNNLNLSKKLRVFFIVAAVSFFITPAGVYSDNLPTGITSQIGTAAVSVNGNSMSVITNDSKWWGNAESFNIGNGYTLNSMGPNASAVMLYNVTGGSGSNIAGIWNSNCNQFLLNPNGVLFSSTAQVNVGGLLASTLAMSKEDFLAGNYVLGANGQLNVVTNAGNIVASNGGVVLAGGAVSNLGVIRADLGTVSLVAGEQVTLTIGGEGNIQAVVNEKILNDVYDQDGNKVNAGVENLGEIRADGGTVYMQVEAVNDVFSNLINQEGVVRAGSMVEKNGKIVLVSDSEGIVQNTGTLDVSGIEDGASGGSIKMFGENVRLFGEAELNASGKGEADGGTIEVGGNYQGNGPDRGSTLTVVGANVNIHADAGTVGDGGDVVIWSDNSTYYVGNITAKGGSISGDGGSVEVSGKENLGYYGNVDTSAVNGNIGTLLLDPENIVIEDYDNGNNPTSVNDGDLPTITGDEGPGSTYYVNEIAIEQSTSDIYLAATNNITMQNLYDDMLDVASANGGITIIADSDGDNVGYFSMDLSDTIRADYITIYSGNGITTGALITLGEAIYLNTSTGNVDINGSVDTNGGSFTALGGNFDNTGATITTDGGAVTINHTGAIIIGAAINAGAGEIDIDSTGAGDITLCNSALTSANAVIDINNANGAIKSSQVSDGTAEIISAGGAIQMEASGGIFDSAGTGGLDLDSGGGAVSIVVDGTANAILDYVSTDADAVSLTLTHSGTGNMTYNSLSTGLLTVNASSGSNGDILINNDAGITIAGALTAVGDITLDSVDSITIDADVTTEGSGTITITADTDSDHTGDVIIAANAASTISSVNGLIDIDGENITIGSGAAGKITTTGTGNVSLDADTAITLSNNGEIDLGGSLSIGQNTEPVTISIGGTGIRAVGAIIADADDTITVTSTVESTSSLVNLEVSENNSSGDAAIIISGNLIGDDVTVTASDDDGATETITINYALNNNRGGYTFEANDGTLDINSSITAQDFISLNGAAGITLNNNLTAADNNITVSDALTLDGNSAITATSGNVTFSSTIDGSYDLTVNAVSGTATFTGIAGGTTPLSSLTVTANNASLNAGISTDNDGNVDFTGTDTVTLTAAVTIDTDAVGGITDAGDVLFKNTGIITGDYDLDIDATVDGTGTDGAVQIARVDTNSLDINTTGTTTLYGNITADDDVSLDGATDLNLAADVTILGDGSTDVLLNGGDVAGDYDLAVEAGSGAVTLGLTAGETEIDVNKLTVTTTGQTSIAGNITADEGIDLSNATNVDMTTNVTLTNTESGTIDLTGGNFDGAFDLTITAGSTDVALGAMGQNTSLGTVAGADTALTVSSTGTTTLSGNITTVTTTGIDFTGASNVVLGADVVIDTGNTTGNVSFSNSGANSLSGGYALRIDAGTGDVTFDNITQLTSLAINDGSNAAGADAVTFNGSVNMPGNVSIIAGIDDGDITIATTGSITAATITLDTDTSDSDQDIIINGNLSTTGNNTISLISGDDVNISQGAAASISAVNGEIDITADDEILLGDGGNTYSGQITTTGTGLIDINAVTAFTMNSNASTKVKSGGAIDIDPDTVIIDGAGLEAVGNITVDATDSITVNGTVNSTSGSVALTVTDTDDDNTAAITIASNIIGDDVTVTAQDANSASETITINSALNNNRGGYAFEANDGTLDINNSITAQDFISLNGAAGITLNNNLTAADNDISINDALTLDGDSTITATSGDVTFAGTVDGTQSLTVNSVAGTTTFGGVVGGTTRLTALTVSADTLRLGGNISTDAAGGANVDFTGTDTVILTADVAIDTDDSANGGDAGDILFKTTGTLDSNAGSTYYNLTLNAGVSGDVAGDQNAGNVQLGTVGRDNALGTLTVNTTEADSDAGTAGDLNLYGNIRANTQVDFSNAPDVNLYADVEIDNDDADLGGVIVLLNGGDVAGDYDLAVDAGSGAVTLGLTAGETEIDVNKLTVTTTGQTSIAGNITADEGIDLSNATNVDMTTNVVLTNTESGTIDLTGGNFDGAFDLTITAGSTNVILGSIGKNVALGDGTQATAALTVTSTGTTTLKGSIDTDDEAVDFDSAVNVVLDADVTIDTTDAGGAITDGANIDFVGTAGNNTLSGNFDLTLNAGVGDIELDNINNIATLTITDSTSTTFSGEAIVVGNVDVNATSNVDGVSAAITVASTGSLTTTAGSIEFDADTLDEITADGDDDGTDAVITINGLVNSAGTLTFDADTVDADDTAAIDINADISGNLTLTSEDDITIDADVTTGGSGTITITADTDSDNTGDVTIGAAADAIVQSVDGLIDIDGENVVLGGAGTDFDGRVLTTGDGAVDIDTVGAFTIADTNADDSKIEAGGDVTVDSASSTITTNGTIQSTSGSVALTAAGDITINGAVSTDGDNGTITITKSGTGAGDITTSAEINTNGNNGTVTILNQGDGSLDDITIGGAIVTASGNVIITTTSGLITLDSGITAGGAGTVSVTAGGDEEGDIDMNAGIITSSGNVSLQADDDILMDNDNADITTTSGSVDIDAGLGTTVGVITMNGPAKIQTSGGDIDLDADGSIILGQLVATAGSVAVTSAVTITGADNATVEITAPTVDLDAGTGIGAAAAAALDLSAATTITADLSGAGDIYIDNAATGDVNVETLTVAGAGLIDYEQTGNQQLTLTTVTTTDGNITVNNTGGTSADILIGSVIADTTDDTVTISAAGSINDNLSDSTADITADIVDLDAVEGIGNIRAVELASVRLIDADSTNGDVNISNTANEEATINSMTTGIGSVNYSQTGNYGLLVTLASVTDGNITIANAGGSDADITVYDINGDTTDGVVTLDSGSTGAIINDPTATSVVAYQLTISEAATVGSDAGADNTVDTSWLDVDVDRLVVTTAGASYFDEAGSINAYDVTTTGELGINAAQNITVTKINSANYGVLLDAVAGAIIDGGDTDVDITAASLRMTAETGIGSSNPIETAVSNLVAETEEGNLRIANTGSLTITSPLDDVVTGLTITDTDDDNEAYYIQVRAFSPLTVDEAVVNNDGGNIILAAEGSDTGDDLTLAADVTAAGGNGDIYLYAGHDILQNAGTVSAAGSGDIYAYAGRDYNGGTIGGGSADGDFTQADGFIMVSTSGNITVAATENAVLSILTTGGNVSVTADDSTYGLNDSGGAITDNLTGDGANIIANIATLRAATGIGSAAPVMTNISALDALNTTSGNIRVTEIAAGTDLNINRATQQSPDGADNDGSVTIQTLNGTLTVVADQNGVTAVDGGTVTLVAGDSDSSYGEDLVINDTINAGTGKVTLTSSGDDVIFGAGGDVTTTSGEIEINAVSGLGLGEGVITMANGTVINAGDDIIDLNAYGDITLGSIVTTSSSSTAGSEAVNINSAAGAIVDGGDDDVDIVANTAGSLVVIDAVTGVGSANSIETTVASIDIDNTASGNINIDETDDITVVKAVQGAAGNIMFVAGGTITADSSGSPTEVIDTPSGTIMLDANGVNSNIVLNDGLFASGDITVSADNDVISAAEGDITSTSGDITVQADANEDEDGTGGAITMADGTLYDAGSGTITLLADEDITLGGLRTTNSTGAAVAISSTSGAVIDGGDAHTDIDANVPFAIVTIDAVKGIGTTDAIDTQVYSIDLDNGTDGDIRIAETDELRVLKAVVTNPQGPEDGDISIVTTNGNLDVVAGALTYAVDTAGDGTITLSAGGGTPDLNIEDGIRSVNGDIFLNATDDVNFGADGDVTSTTGDVTVTADSDNGGVASGALTMNNATLINAGSGTITLNADEDITLGGLLTTSTSDEAVVLTSQEGGIVDGGAAYVDVVAASGRLVIDAVTGVGSAGNIDTTVASLDIDNTTSGNIDINETDAVSVIQLDQDGPGTVNLDAGGTITVASAADGGVGVTSTSGQVELDANGTTSDVLVYNIITTTGGTVNVYADNDVTFSNAGDITSGGAGNVLVNADADDTIAGIGGAIFMADVDNDSTIIDAGTGTITLLADEDITLGGLTTANTSNSSIIITSDSGSVIDGGDTAIDIDANTTADTSGVRITAATGIGTDANALETTVETLSATTAAGDIHIINTGEMDIINDGTVNGVRITAGSVGDNITIITQSPLNVDADVVNAGGGDILLAAEGTAATDDLTINDVITASGGNGNITLYAGDTISQNSAAVTAAGSGTITYYAGVDYNSGTPQAGLASGASDIIMDAASTVVAGTGDITMTAPDSIQISSISTSGNVSLTADDSTYINSDSTGAITEVLATEAANITASTATLRAATGIGAADDIDTNITTLDALNSTSGDMLITEIAAGGDLNVNQATQSALGNLVVQTEDGTLTVVADQSGVASTTGTVTLIAGDSDSNYADDLVINDTVTTTTGNITLTSSGDDIRFGAGGDVTSTSGNVDVNAESGAGLGEGMITMADGAVIDSGTGQIDMDAYGDITLGGLATTYTADDAVAVTSVAGGIIDGGDTDVDITANTASAIVDLDAATGIGSDNALETSIYSLEANNTTSGNIKISEADAINLLEIINSAAGGSIDITVGGTITTTTVTSGGAVNLYATAGDIIDTAGGLITAGAGSSLKASGIIGTTVAPYNPVDVDINGDLWVWAGGEQNRVSVITQGRVVSTAKTERTEIFKPAPTGLVIHDNRLMGGGNYGSGSTNGSILSRGYGETRAVIDNMYTPYYIRALQPWGYMISGIRFVTGANNISEEFLNEPWLIMDGSAVGIEELPTELLIVPEDFWTEGYFIKKYKI